MAYLGKVIVLFTRTSYWPFSKEPSYLFFHLFILLRLHLLWCVNFTFGYADITTTQKQTDGHKNASRCSSFTLSYFITSFSTFYCHYLQMTRCSQRRGHYDERGKNKRNAAYIKGRDSERFGDRKKRQYNSTNITLSSVPSFYFTATLRKLLEICTDLLLYWLRHISFSQQPSLHRLHLKIATIT